MNHQERLRAIQADLKRLRSNLHVCLTALRSDNPIADDVAELLDHSIMPRLSETIDELDAAVEATAG